MLSWGSTEEHSLSDSPFSRQSPVVAAGLLVHQNLSPFLEIWMLEMVAEAREALLHAKCLQMDS